MGGFFSTAAPSNVQTNQNDVHIEKPIQEITTRQEKELQAQPQPLPEPIKIETENNENIPNVISTDVDKPNVVTDHVTKKKKPRSREESEKDSAPKPKKVKTAKTEKTENKKTNPIASAPINGDLLSEYKEASTKWGGNWLNGFKWKVTDPKGTMQRWLECNKDDARIKQLSVIAQAGSKSVYAFWMHSGRTEADAPVVFLGSDGEAWLVASSVAQFISLQAAGLDGDMLKAWDGKDEEFDTITRDEYCESFQQFLNWVKSKKIKPSAKSKVFKTIKQEARQHPPLKKFLFPKGKVDNYDDDD